MRISDWSSDVCSSDLLEGAIAERGQAAFEHRILHVLDLGDLAIDADHLARALIFQRIGLVVGPPGRELECPRGVRSEERRVGKEVVSKCRSRVLPYHSKKNTSTPSQRHT